jgi:ATP-dependent DNA helicase RecG
MALSLNSKIEALPRIGKTTASRLKRLEIVTVADALWFLPFRYEDYSESKKISELQAGERVNIMAEIELIESRRSPRQRMNITEALVKDESESLKVIWFNQPFISRNLRPGDKVSLSGLVSEDFNGLVMKSPEYEKITTQSGTHTQGLVPIYHSTLNLTQKQIRYVMKLCQEAALQIEDWLPSDIIKSNKLMDLAQALRTMHFPDSFAEMDKARHRLKFNELFLLQLKSELIRLNLKNAKAPILNFKKKKARVFISSLPFTLTNAQKAAAWEILQDIEQSQPMARLLEGDVGSGKTVVAVMALLMTALNKKQAGLMVPTEILAIQHFNSISKLLAPFPIKIALLTGSQKLGNWEIGKLKKIELAKEADIIIGTHALIQEKIKFKNLALAVIDEQHRFGVEQRKTLLTKSGLKGKQPHLLSMTATPIPRSLALALYGDLDLSVIKEMPKGRQAIQTFVVPEQKRSGAYDFIKKEVKAGRQVFVICPLIDLSDKLGVKSATNEYKKLNEQIFPNLQLGLLHGRLKAKDKDAVMQDFVNGKTQILVSTSVVEVGVDVPNATIMMIEDADRFGLSQLHQFRGRVGRGEHQSYCLLFTDSNSQTTLERLQAMTKYNDGFELSKIDLKFRGPGEVYGLAQKGFPELKIASIFDAELIKTTRAIAQDYLANNPEIIQHPMLKEQVEASMRGMHLE